MIGLIIILIAFIVLFATLFATYIVDNTIFPLNLITGLKLKKEILKRNLIKKGWKLKEVSGGIARFIEDGWWEIYVKFSKINEPYICTNTVCYFKPSTKEIKNFCPHWW